MPNSNHRFSVCDHPSRSNELVMRYEDAEERWRDDHQDLLAELQELTKHNSIEADRLMASSPETFKARLAHEKWIAW